MSVESNLRKIIRDLLRWTGCGRKGGKHCEICGPIYARLDKIKHIEGQCCPDCKSKNINYEDNRFADDFSSVECDAECNDCGAIFTEVYELVCVEKIGVKLEPIVIE